MSKSTIDKAFGREAFGLDPGGYHRARPAYPEWVYELMVERCGLRQHTATFEIGPGTGIATRRLLEFGANPLVAIEPDGRLAKFLSATIPNNALKVVPSSFEDFVLPDEGFDLGVSATAFHWLNEETALAKVASLLKPGGWWVMFWNVFGDPDRADPFHEATQSLLEGPIGPSREDLKIPYALDSGARMAKLEKSNAFDSLEYRCSTWSLVLDADQTVSLYATYSNINIRPDRAAVLEELGRIARDQFQGRVVRNMITSLYMARRI